MLCESCAGYDLPFGVCRDCGWRSPPRVVADKAQRKDKWVWTKNLPKPPQSKCPTCSGKGWLNDWRDACGTCLGHGSISGIRLAHLQAKSSTRKL